MEQPESCFEFDWKQPEGDKVLFLHHIPFLFQGGMLYSSLVISAGRYNLVRGN